MKHALRNGLIVLTLLLSWLLLSGFVAASAKSDEGYIYGRITMDNGHVYQGSIRWGDEEAFWDDMFNSDKDENVFDRYYSELRNIDDIEDEFIDQQDRRRRRSSSWSFRRFLRSEYDRYDVTHQFKCRFGDIKSMRLRGSSSVLLRFKNGEELKVRGGSNDIGTSLKVYDDEIGEIELNWRRIEDIDFLPTPKELDYKFGNPLFAEVETAAGRFRGFIQWDRDECLSTDILDGDSEDGDLEIPFGKIQSIEKYRRGSLVTLNSGRELYLTGSNDVNRENRGIMVKDPEYGTVSIGWDDFEKADFDHEVENSGSAYDHFPKSAALAGEVKLRDGKTIAGQIIYDMDEAFDFEILDGKDGAIEYLIPFRNIKRIIPDRYYGSMIVLRSDREVELEDSRDVDEDNDGIIVWNRGDEARYIPWRRIEEIVFD